MWKTINFNIQNIEYTTYNATLITMPKKSKYAGFKFWHPSKLVRDNGGKGYFKSFSYTDQFEFKLFKNGNGKYNGHEIIDEIILTPKEIEEAFDITNKNIDSANNQNKETFVEVKKPNKINVEVDVNEELLNN